MAYKIIDEIFWTDPHVQGLGVKEKLLLLYLVTNPHTHYSGVYYLPLPFIVEETGLQNKDIKKGLATLADGSFARYDVEKKVMWVRNMARHQLKQGNQKNILLGIANHLKKLHKSFLIKEFLEYYSDLEIPIETPCQWDTEPMPESVSGEVSGEGEVPAPPKKIYGEHKNVKLTKIEYQKLQALTMSNHLGNYIERLSDYLKQGNKYKCHYSALRTWLRKDGLLKKPPPKGKPPAARKPEPELSDQEQKNGKEALKKIREMTGGVGSIPKKGA